MCGVGCILWLLKGIMRVYCDVTMGFFKERKLAGWSICLILHCRCRLSDGVAIAS